MSNLEECKAKLEELEAKRQEIDESIASLKDKIVEIEKTGVDLNAYVGKCFVIEQYSGFQHLKILSATPTSTGRSWAVRYAVFDVKENSDGFSINCMSDDEPYALWTKKDFDLLNPSSWMRFETAAKNSFEAAMEAIRTGHETSDEEKTDEWPPFTNCQRCCRSCQAKCLYRKEEYGGGKNDDLPLSF